MSSLILEYRKTMKSLEKLSTLLQLLSVCFISSKANTYSPLEVCAFRRVCDGRFGKKPTEMTTTELGNSPCYCDEDCIIYSDCCYDAPVQWFARSDPSSFTCAPIPMMDYSIYVKRLCNKGWHNGNSVRQLCEHPNTEEILSNVYVTSISHRITYGSIFCAVCNGEKYDETDLKFWEIQISLPIKFGSEEVTSTKDLFQRVFRLSQEGWVIDQEIKKSITDSIAVINNIPVDVDKSIHLRRCKMTIDKCAGAWFNPSVEQRCKAFNHFVYDRTTFQLYKNLYCALCNFITYGNLRCLKSDILGINDDQSKTCPSYHYYNNDKNMCMPFPFLLPMESVTNLAGYDTTNLSIPVSVIHNCPAGYSLYGLNCLPDISQLGNNLI